MKWLHEYDDVTTKSYSKDWRVLKEEHDEILKKRSLDGWELVNIFQIEGMTVFRIYWKKPAE
jgi:hypothetical protein